MNNIEDFERCAPALLDTLSREYIWSGSGSEKTLWENKEAFKRIWIKKRVLRGIVNYTLETTVLGQKIGCPIGISPTIGHLTYHPEGDNGTARGGYREVGGDLFRRGSGLWGLGFFGGCFILNDKVLLAFHFDILGSSFFPDSGAS
ncbi:hypothetical protein NPIL_222631 [Nephila pilipes]|uniref:FMN hydroxy acid dehydrogenase domain-containing protein n=1 Tax=Nephila pilipes TaxID=299642 RepID=A0A8X6U1P5_NEPPI|nr:hypothetical protein NPIL_222631 [Nephila pilipes]